MIIIHGYRATTLLLSILLNVLVRTEYPVAATAVIVAANSNSLEEGMTMRPVDIELSTTLPLRFGTENSTVISAQAGSTALLPCVVHNLGDVMVRF